MLQFDQIRCKSFFSKSEDVLKKSIDKYISKESALF